MANEFENKIKRLELENFTCFSKAEFDFSSGINVFIGENGTGKTHLLKVLYASTHTHFVNSEKRKDYTLKWAGQEEDFASYFGKSSIGSLKRNNTFEEEAQIQLQFKNDNLEIKFNFEEGWFNWNPSGESSYIQISKRIFIPVQEMLSWQKGFTNYFLKHENDFDKTFFDLAILLQGNLLRGKALNPAKKLISELEKEIGIKVTKKGEEFFISKNGKQSEVEATLNATGLNKIAQIIYLVLNGSITKDTILLWDEPCVNLNPKYITVITKFLLALAKAGCQIFVATHDYLLVHQLSTNSEYRDVQPDVPDMKFFSLINGENGTEVEAGENMAQIQHNPILDEYAKLFDWESELHRKSLFNEQA